MERGQLSAQREDRVRFTHRHPASLFRGRLSGNLDPLLLDLLWRKFIFRQARELSLPLSNKDALLRLSLRDLRTLRGRRGTVERRASSLDPGGRLRNGPPAAHRHVSRDVRALLVPSRARGTISST